MRLAEHELQFLIDAASLGSKPARATVDLLAKGYLAGAIRSTEHAIKNLRHPDAIRIAGRVFGPALRGGTARKK